MKRLVLALVACLATSAFAQPAPKHPRDARQDRIEWSEHRPYKRLTCREWRRAVREHPRLILPRRCWRHRP
jgi:hypothetical protein